MAFKIVGTVENNVKQFSVEFPDLFLTKNENTPEMRSTRSTNNSHDCGKVLDKLDTLMNNFEEIIQQQQEIITQQNRALKNQTEILEKLTKLENSDKNNQARIQSLQAAVDVGKVTNFPSNSTASTASYSHSEPVESNFNVVSVINSLDLEQFKFTQITTLTEFDQFDENLEDDKYKSELFQRMIIVCGESRKTAGSGANAAYTLIDIFFARKLLTEFSWSGGSKGDKEKYCFREYKNFVMFFFSLIHAIDETFSYNDCAMFFKQILKNATRRNQAGQSTRMRASCSRKRRANRVGKLEGEEKQSRSSKENGVSHSENENENSPAPVAKVEETDYPFLDI